MQTTFYKIKKMLIFTLNNLHNIKNLYTFAPCFTLNGRLK